jgi:hypothetical protein
MAEVVSKTGCFNYVRIETSGFNEFRWRHVRLRQVLRDAPANLRDLQAMCQPIVEDVALRGMNDLSNTGESAKSGRIQDAVAIALKFFALITRTRTLVAAGLSSCLGLWRRGG